MVTWWVGWDRVDAGQTAWPTQPVTVTRCDGDVMGQTPSCNASTERVPGIV